MPNKQNKTKDTTNKRNTENKQYIKEKPKPKTSPNAQ